MGHEYASDGYIWGPAEEAFQIEVSGGYVNIWFSYNGAPGLIRFP